MRKVLFKKWIPKEWITEDGKNYKTTKPGTGKYEEDYVNEGMFLGWGNGYELGENSYGNYTYGIIELTDGTIEEVLPTNIKFIS